MFFSLTKPVTSLVLERPSVIEDLRAEADFRSVTLDWNISRWTLREWPMGRATFRITSCEIQFWGTNKCRTQTMANGGEFSQGNAQSGWRHFRTTVSNLRLATNYTIEVMPTGSNDQPRSITIQTKGFEGYSSHCMDNTSRVEVETGPFFGGRISAEEAASRPGCFIDGDRTSAQSRYSLVIDHYRCASRVMGDGVMTHIIVQENPSIVTHTAKRFVVTCHNQPEVFVVESGMKMPVAVRDKIRETSSVDFSRNLISHNHVANVMEQELDDKDRESRKFSTATTNGKKSKTSQAQLVIMIVLLLCTLIGLSAGTLVLILRKQSRRSNCQKPTPITHQADVLLGPFIAGPFIAD